MFQQRRDFNRYLKEAKKGNRDAQRSLAACYMEGVGCRADPDEAAVWLQKASSKEQSPSTAPSSPQRKHPKPSRLASWVGGKSHRIIHKSPTTVPLSPNSKKSRPVYRKSHSNNKIMDIELEESYDKDHSSNHFDEQEDHVTVATASSSVTSKTSKSVSKKRYQRRWSIGTSGVASNHQHPAGASASTAAAEQTTSSSSIPLSPKSPQQSQTRYTDERKYYSEENEDSDDGMYGYVQSQPPVPSSSQSAAPAPKPRKKKKQFAKRLSMDAALSLVNSTATTSSSHSNNKAKRSSMRRRSAYAVPGGDSGVDRERMLNYNTNYLVSRANELDHHASEMCKEGKFEQAFMFFERALELKRSTLEAGQEQEKRTKKSHKNSAITEDQEAQMATMLASMATSINNMTYLKQRRGQASADETMAAYIKSLQIKREVLGPDHLSVGKTLSNIGSVFYLKKEFVPALKAYENAYDIMAAQLGSHDLEVGTVLANLGDVHFQMGHREEALSYYKRAIDIRWVPLGNNDPKVVRLLERTAWLEMGQQPCKDDFSDSDDEEYVRDEQRKKQNFQNELHALQNELDEEIQKINLEIFNERTNSMEIDSDDDGGDQPTPMQRESQSERPSISAQQSNSARLSTSFRALKLSFVATQKPLELGNIGESEDESDGGDDESSKSSASVHSSPPDLHYWTYKEC